VALIAALLLLAGFAAWGAWRGSLRQAGSLLLLCGAFVLAGALGPRLEGAVAKVATLSEAEQVALAWVAAFVLALLLGGVLLSALQPWLRRLLPPGPVERWVGAALGVLHGILLLAVVGYGLLVAWPVAARPPWLARMESGPVGRGLVRVRQTVGGALPLPAWLETRLDGVDARIGS
jgi:uncharacterized membrane protein required for colicin V production